MPEQLKAVLYMRVSSEEQKERQTIQSQRKSVLDWCSSRGITIIKEFADDGVSGAIPVSKRAAGASLFAAARAGEFDTVVVFKLDRLGRDMYDALDTLRKFQNLGVVVRSIREQYDMTTTMGQFMAVTAAFAAQIERDNIIDRSISGHMRSAGDGKWQGGPPPFGYDIGPDSRLVINEEQAIVVRMIFDLYARDRLSTTKIAVYLNDTAVPCPRRWTNPQSDPNQRWNYSTITRILHETAYIGQVQYNKTQSVKRDGVRVGYKHRPKDSHVAIACPPIIDEKRFRLVQELMKDNSKHSKRNAKRFYLLSGLVECGVCKSAYTGVSASVPYKGVVTKYSYYRCTSVSYPFKVNCGNKGVVAADLEREVWDQVLSILLEPDEAIDQFKQARLDQNEDVDVLKSSINQLEKVIASKKGERQKLAMQNAKGILDDDDLATLTSQLRSEEQVARDQIEVLSGRVSNVMRAEAELDDSADVLREIATHLKDTTPEWQQWTVRQLVRRVVISPVVECGLTTAEAEVFWSIPRTSNIQHGPDFVDCYPSVSSFG